MYTVLSRQEVASFMREREHVSFVHDSGPAHGKPYGKRLLNRVISQYIAEQKAQGNFIENRFPQVDKQGRPRLPRQYTVLPQQQSFSFNESAEAGVGQSVAARPRNG